MKSRVDQRLDGFSAFPVPIVVSDPMRSSATDPTLAGTAVTTSATAHTKGASWAEIIASTAAEAEWIGLLVYSTASAGLAGNALMDIALGGAGSEVIVVPNVSVSNASVGSGTALGVMLPVHVPKGSRISVKWQSGRASASSCGVHMTLYGWPPGWSQHLRSPVSLDNINAVTATTLGTSAGATSNEWVQVVASAARSYQGFVATPCTNDAGMSADNTQIDIGVGASGSERWMTIPQMWETNNSEYYIPYSWAMQMSYVPLRCPAGARIALRMRDGAQSLNNPGAVILGVPYA